jgi:competence protein ComEC
VQVNYLFIVPLPAIYIWKKAPFLRLLLPLIAGIILQWHLQMQLKLLWLILAASAFIVAVFFLIPFFERYRLSFLNGISIALLFISLGALLAWHKDIRHQENWLGNKYNPGDGLLVTLLEPPVEKTKSIKANASVDYILQNGTALETSGTIILYFKKDSAINNLPYGTQVLFRKPLQEIKNSGNPGGFDYKRYSLFHGVTHQVYLKENEFEIVPGENKNRFNEFILSTRKKVLNILRTNIKSEKERGLAEALLIGYKDDLDKTLVQSYTNTGVVHVIAISGLHLGLIYWLLLQLLKPLQKRKRLKWLRPVLIIAGLWLFSLLAGAQPSVIRSAVMFTCIVLGETWTRKTSIFNTLAFSAFLLLCYNPYWLWDVGFQLSYAAVLSIAIFMQPIYNWFYIKNKALDFLWKLNAVTLAAQLLTLPVSICHFHQFPNYFLLTNFLAVPLSSLILLGEIALCVIAFIPLLATLLGKLLAWLIRLMNSYIERIELLPFSLFDGLQITILQAALLIAAVAGLGFWLMEKSKPGLKTGLVALLGFFVLRTFSFINADSQRKIIVYNVPQKQAIDFIDGRNYFFEGDADLLADDFIRNFHIKPSRVLHRTGPGTVVIRYRQADKLIEYNGKKILLLDTTVYFSPLQEKLNVDILVISKNPRIYFSKLVQTFDIKQVVFDGSAASRKLKYWKKDCDSLRIPYHDVTEKGAFQMKIR